MGRLALSGVVLSTRLDARSISRVWAVSRGLHAVALVSLLLTAACVDLSEDGFAPVNRVHGGRVTPLGGSSGGIWTPPEGDVVQADLAGDDVLPSFDALGDLPVAVDVAPETAGPGEVELQEAHPELGATAGGDLVTLRGQGFQAGLTVWFGHRAAPDVFVLSSEYVNVHTPPGPSGAVDVLVVNPDGGRATLPAGFTYRPTLRLDSLDPEQGLTIGGAVVTLVGDGFEAPVEVYVGGRAAIDVQRQDDAHITFVAPPGREGPADLVVFAAGQRFVTDRAFRYVAAPVLLGLEPPAGPVTGDRLVRLHGRGLTPEAQVTFGARRARVLSALPGRWLDVRLPEGAPGLATVRVATTLGDDEAPGSFLYHDGAPAEAAPQALGFWPDRGPAAGGGEIVVLARGLDAAPSLAFGGTPAAVLDVRPDEGWLRAQVPPGVPGTSTLTLQVDGLPLFVGSYAYEAAPVLEAAEPPSAPAAGGAQVVLRVRDLPPGDVQVRFDGLDALSVHRLDDRHLQVVAPAGSPGPARLRLVTALGEVQATDLFAFTTDQRRLVGTSPALLPENGGAWVRVFGTRFEGPLRVTIGGTRCDQLQVVSSVELRCLSPHAVVGLAPLEVIGAEGDALWSEVVPDAVTIYEPRKKKGGTLGEPVAGVLSVTAIDGGTGYGLPGATAYLRLVDGSGRATGTDYDGHATFSFDELVGPVDVSVVKPGYSASSVLGFDASRVTVYLYSSSVPEPGEGPPPQPTQTQYGKITGAVTGVDKYLPIPPGTCSAHAAEFPVLCQPCVDDGACGPDGGFCAELDEGSFCLTPCVSDADCPATFACAGVAGGHVACLPRLGEPQTRCALSKPSLFSYVGGVTELSEVGPQGTFQVVARPGDVAIVCTAGVVRFDDGTFVPLVMGVRRNVFVPQGMYVPDQDVVLDLPLTREVRVSLQDVPSHPAGNKPLEIRSFVTLGTDGVIELDTGKPEIVGDQARLQRFPSSLSGGLEGGTYAFYATARADTPEWYPYSVVLDQDIPYLTSGGVLAGSGSTWALTPMLSDRDLVALAGDVPGDLVAVGDRGLVLRQTSSGWFPQYSPLTADWRGVCRRADGSEVIVGREGAVLERSPGQPYAVLPTGVPRDLLTCREVDGVTWVGGVGLVMEEVNGDWHKTWLGPDEAVRGFVQAGGSLFAFTGAGVLYQRKLVYWVPVPTPWEAGEPLVAGADGWLVSERGHVFRHDGQAWRYDVTLEGTPRALAPAGDLPCVVGDDGGVWCRGSEGWGRPAGLPEALPDLLAARVLSDGSLVAVGRQARRLGPFMPYPTLVSPVQGGQLVEPRFVWDVGTAVRPSFLQMSLIAPGTGSFWTVVAAGDSHEMRLPPGPFPPDQAFALFSSASSPSFDIDHFIYADTSSTLRRTWAQAYRDVVIAPALVDFGSLP